MEHPKVENIRIIADTFLNLYESGESGEKEDRCELDFCEPLYHPCGTVACHAGWFGIAAINSNSDDVSCLNGREYIRAEQLMSYFAFTGELGSLFKGLPTCTDGRLAEWAGKNHDLWGNSKGSLMFCGFGYEAFGEHINKMTLKEVGTYWHGVADRMEAAGVGL